MALIEVNKRFNFRRFKVDSFRNDLSFIYFEDDKCYLSDAHIIIRIYFDDLFKSNYDIDFSQLQGKKLSVESMIILQNKKFQFIDGEFVINDDTRIKPSVDDKEFLKKIKSVFGVKGREDYATSTITFPLINYVGKICKGFKRFRLDLFTGNVAFMNYLDSTLIHKLTIMILGEYQSDSEDFNVI